MTLPAPALKRLQSALYRQRPRCVKHDVPYEAIKADALLAKADQNEAGQYLCMTCAGPMSFRAEMVPNKATVGHVLALSTSTKTPDGHKYQNHPGHVLSNCGLECWECNQADNCNTVAKTNATARNFAVVKGRPKSGKIQSRNQWPTGRKIQSRGFGR